MLQGPPRFLEMHLIGQHERCFCSGPVKKIMHIPSPLGHVGDGGCHGSLDCVPGVLLASEVVMCGLPSLLELWKLVSWPCLDELVHGSDMVDDYLVAWVSIPFAVDVVDDVKDSSIVVS